MKPIEFKLLSSLEKVFPEKNLYAREVNAGSMLKDEIFSFQLSFRSDSGTIKARIGIESEISSFIEVYNVGLVRSDLPAYEVKDEDYISKEPGLFPDVLYPNHNLTFDIANGKWGSMWFSVNGKNVIKAGNYPLKINVFDSENKLLAQKVFDLRVIDKRLPKQKLIHTEWFYTDCIAAYYNTEVFSETYWELVKRYMKIAVKYGVNMILTPVFTPPLDTPFGKERLTVQLVDVKYLQGKYIFGFDKLKRWITLAEQCGMVYFEISHLFTQWGAKHAPKIMVETEEGLKQHFGWYTNAADEEYKDFIICFLKALVAFIDMEGIRDKCFFHVSDEPQIWDMEMYKSAVETMRYILKDEFIIIDALSDYEFFSSGAVKNPIPSNDHVDVFIANNVRNLWTYYCCAQGEKVSNRFMSMPSYRNRIIGMQLYEYGFEGFLHWGFNFWFRQNLLEIIDPFCVTDAGKAFPSGDAFLVYPGEKEPLPSIRMLVFNEALQDIRAFELLEALSGKEVVKSLITPKNDKEITFSEYPRNNDFILSVRERINDRIAESLENCT